MKKKWTGERLEKGIYNDTTIEHLHRYAIAMDFAKGKHVLDVACGDGYGSNLLAKVATSVIGIDNKSTVISEARSKYKATNLRFENGNIEHLPVSENSIDLVTCFETLEHTSEHEKAMVEIKRVLKPDGLLLISTPDKKEYSEVRNYANPFHKKELYLNEFKQLLELNFAFVKIYIQRMVSGSLLTGELDAVEYNGDFERIDKKSFTGFYFFAVASQSSLPKMNMSVFTSKSILEVALKQQEETIMNTLTYKVGHSLLFPFKMIRNLIR